MSIATKAINKYIDCNHKMIFHAIFHRNRNTPNIGLLILNKMSNSQKDSEKEHSWTHLPLRLQTTSRSGCTTVRTCTNTDMWTRGRHREPRSEATCMRSVHEHQTGNERRGKDSLLKKQGQENWPPALKNITGHPPDHLTEI